MTEENKSLTQQLIHAIIKGDQDLSVKLAQQLSSQGWKMKKYFLPELNQL